MLLNVIGADTNHLGTKPMELLQIALKTARFEGAAAGEILGIEVKRQPSTLEVTESKAPGWAEIRAESRQRKVGSRLIKGRQGSTQGAGLEGPAEQGSRQDGKRQSRTGVNERSFQELAAVHGVLASEDDQILARLMPSSRA
jgi:hypothetical protein